MISKGVLNITLPKSEEAKKEGNRGQGEVILHLSSPGIRVECMGFFASKRMKSKES